MITKAQLNASLERSRKNSNKLVKQLKALTNIYTDQAKTIRKLKVERNDLEERCRKLGVEKIKIQSELGEAKDDYDRVVTNNTALTRRNEKLEEIGRLKYPPNPIDVTEGHIVETSFDRA